ncbi:haloacid dehalogenase [Enterococcus saigonensis]|uniref:Haloacid dehalogenase n=1 Tax=Enterococcus saigonensis TaxID=1805431 RepID=A0A679IPV0_9ENTE|nr:HAD family hydrolase [Enterococcus saigonensis]BCA85077.1 haloacid dehalogenase [Enterococcus saigonensis]
MKKPIEMANEFHQIFDPRIPNEPTAFQSKEAIFRAGFKIEELVEFIYESTDTTVEFEQSVVKLHEALDAAKDKVLKKSTHNHQIKSDHLVGQVDALADLLYLTYGSFALMNIDPAPVLEIVHKANMSKLFPDGKPHYDPLTNKVLKPASWQEKYAPEKKIKAELNRQKNVAKLGN